MPLGTEIGRSPGHIVLDGDPALPKRGIAAPQLSAHVYCGQMAEWIRIPGDVLLDGDLAPPTERGKAAPHFALPLSPISAAGFRVRVRVRVRVSLV